MGESSIVQRAVAEAALSGRLLSNTDVTSRLRNPRHRRCEEETPWRSSMQIPMSSKLNTRGIT